MPGTQLQNTAGIGVGLSTADTLTSSLGGKLNICSTSQNENSTTEIKFTVRTTSISNCSTFN